MATYTADTKDFFSSLDNTSSDLLQLISSADSDNHQHYSICK